MTLTTLQILHPIIIRLVIAPCSFGIVPSVLKAI